MDQEKNTESLSLKPDLIYLAKGHISQLTNNSIVNEADIKIGGIKQAIEKETARKILTSGVERDKKILREALDADLVTLRSEIGNQSIVELIKRHPKYSEDEKADRIKRITDSSDEAETILAHNEPRIMELYSEADDKNQDSMTNERDRS